MPGAAKRNGKKTGQVRFLPIDEILPAPENDRLYKPVSPDDPAIAELAESIRTLGFNQPVIISTDNFILSGHRRRVAAMLAGLKELPYIVENVFRLRADGSINPDFIRRLEMYNRQREKTLDEKLREAVVRADPKDAHRVLAEYREQRARLDTDEENLIELREEKRRAGISPAKYPMCNAIIRTLDSMRKYLPLSVRQIHYLLLNDPPLRHASKPKSTYRNDSNSYKDLTDLTVRLRLMGNIPMDWIADDTRPEVITQCFDDSADFMREEVDGLLKGYYRNLMQSQPNHIEIIGEKLTLLSIIEQVALKYCVPLTIGRGFSGLPSRHKINKRYQKSGKEKLILLVLADLDPDGEEIGHSFARSMRDDFNIPAITPIKVALKSRQVRERKIPPGGHIDDKNNRPEQRPKKERFRSKYGDHTYELEALKPDDLRQILDDAICSVLDIEAYNYEVDRETEEAAYLDEQRQRMLKAIEEGKK